MKLKKLKFDNDEPLAIMGYNRKLVGGKVKVIADKVNEIIDILNKKERRRDEKSRG